jgi:predicted nuclease of predicted toxin-antitoxin system
MRFLVDAQLPPSLAWFLRTLGEEAMPCRDVGLRDADDDEIWRFATAGGFCIVTKDEDFALRHLADPSGPQVVWLRIGNSTNPALLEWLQPLWGDVARELRNGQGLVEVGERAKS